MAEEILVDGPSLAKVRDVVDFLKSSAFGNEVAITDLCNWKHKLRIHSFSSCILVLTCINLEFIFNVIYSTTFLYDVNQNVNGALVRYKKLKIV